MKLDFIDKVIKDIEKSLKEEEENPIKNKIFRDIEILEIMINTTRNRNKKLKLIKRREELIRKL